MYTVYRCMYIIVYRYIGYDKNNKNNVIYAWYIIVWTWRKWYNVTMFWCLVFRILTNSVAPGGRLGFRVAEAVVGFLALGCFETLSWLKIEGSNMTVFLCFSMFSIFFYVFLQMDEKRIMIESMNQWRMINCLLASHVNHISMVSHGAFFFFLNCLSCRSSHVSFVSCAQIQLIRYCTHLIYTQIFVQWRMELPEDEGRINLMLYIPTSWAGYSQCDLPETYPQISSHDTVLCPFSGDKLLACRVLHPRMLQ